MSKTSSVTATSSSTPLTRRALLTVYAAILAVLLTMGLTAWQLWPVEEITLIRSELVMVARHQCLRREPTPETASELQLGDKPCP